MLAAQPATLKEVLAVEATWKVNERLYKEYTMARSVERSLLTKETAHAFLSRVADARSDAERKHVPVFLKGNWAQVESLVLKPAEGVDAATTKRLRDALDRIAKAPSAAPADQAEVRRALDSAK